MSEIIIQDQLVLTVDERSELETLEKIIERGKQTFVEVGNALMEIREKRLYRETHSTFESYTQERWDFSSSRARQLIGAAQIVASLPESVTGVTPPITEFHTRPLAALAPDLRERVWREAVLSAPDGNVTRDHVQAVVDQALGKRGRFDTQLVYAVFDNDQIVYLPGFARENLPYHDKRFHKLAWMDGEHLNQTRRFDAYELKEMPEIPALPKELENGFWLDRNQGQIFPMGDEWRPYLLRKLVKIMQWDAEETWRSVKDKDIRSYKICTPLIWQDPSWLEQSRFRPGAEAWCPVCGGVGKPYAAFAYEHWLPNPDKPRWLCRYGHWIADADIVIVESNVSAPPPTPAPDAVDVSTKDNYDDSEEQILDEISDAENLLRHLVDMPDLVALATDQDRVRQYNESNELLAVEVGSLARVRTILEALESHKRLELSRRYGGVLAYFQFMSGWYYAVDQVSKIIYWQADASVKTCEDLFPGCVAVKGSSLIDDREVYLKAGYRLVIELVDRNP